MSRVAVRMLTCAVLRCLSLFRRPASTNSRSLTPAVPGLFPHFVDKANASMAEGAVGLLILHAEQSHFLLDDPRTQPLQSRQVV